jgi:hypothetical protein
MPTSIKSSNINIRIHGTCKITTNIRHRQCICNLYVGLVVDELMRSIWISRHNKS